MSLGQYLTEAGRAGFRASAPSDRRRWELRNGAGHALELYPRADLISRWIWRGRGISITGYNLAALTEFLVKV